MFKHSRSRTQTQSVKEIAEDMTTIAEATRDVILALDEAAYAAEHKFSFGPGGDIADREPLQTLVAAVRTAIERLEEITGMTIAEAWAKRLELQAQGMALGEKATSMMEQAIEMHIAACPSDNHMVAKGMVLYGEGEALRLKSEWLNNEADRVFVAAVIAEHGVDAILEWDFGAGSCKVGDVVYKPLEVTG